MRMVKATRGMTTPSRGLELTNRYMSQVLNCIKIAMRHGSPLHCSNDAHQKIVTTCVIMVRSLVSTKAVASWCRHGLSTLIPSLWLRRERPSRVQ